MGHAGRGARPGRAGGGATTEGAAAGGADAAAYREALRALARRPHGTAELQAVLVGKGHAAGSVRHALSRLQGLGYLDDLAYARLLTSHWVGRRGVGPARLRQVLAAKGLPEELVAAAAAEAFAATDETAAAVAAGRRRLRGLGGVDRRAARRRLAGYLSRRGYGGEAVAQALRILLGGGSGEAPGEA